MKEKPILKLYKYEDSQFKQIAQIDDYQEISFEHNLYSAGTFTITINYNIPNALLFERGMFIQFGSDPYDFGEILSIRDSIGQDGKGSQIRTITGYDARYIFKRRIIKNLNSNGMWKMTAKGEVCIRELIKSECGLLAEEKRQLPIKNIPSYLNEFESEPLPVNDCYWGGCHSKEKNLFILTGEQGTILRSRDAFNWEIALNLGGGWFERCFYSDHYHAFFAVGNSANGSETQVSYIYKSTDGIAWTKVYQSESFIYLTDICENDNGVLVAVGRYYIVRSTNGTSWNLIGSEFRFQGVYFAKEVFIGLLYNGIATSRNGSDWRRVNNIQGHFFYACYSSKYNKIVAVGRYIYESFDGVNFILVKTPEQYPLRFISWNDEKEMFYACGFTGYAIRSRDGYEWEEIDLPIEKTNSTYLTGIFFSEEFRTFIFGGFFNPNASIYLAQKINAVGKEYSVSEQFTNLYEVCKTIATQSEIGWRVKFDNGILTLECYSGTDRSNTVQFSTDFDSLRDGEFSDSSESYSNAIYIGGKGQNDERDIYEGEDGTPNGLDRFEAWDDQSQMTTTDEYTAEALSMLSQYGQTVNVSGNGLAKCPYIYKEQYDVGDIITIAFSGKTAKVQILSVTERWAWNQYDINFSFGKPQNTLSEQLQLMLRKIQGASNKANATESVKWYTIPTAASMPADDVTFNTIGFTGTMTANSTFTLYRDSEGTGAKSYNIYAKNLSGNYNLTLTTGVSGATNFTIKGGQNIVARILVDENGNIVSQSMTATDLIESGNNQPATSGGVANALSSLVDAKADKVSSATNGNLASLDANGNLADSGINKEVVPPVATSKNKLSTSLSDVTLYATSNYTKLIGILTYGRPAVFIVSSSKGDLGFISIAQFGSSTATAKCYWLKNKVLNVSLKYINTLSSEQYTVHLIFNRADSTDSQTIKLVSAGTVNESAWSTESSSRTEFDEGVIADSILMQPITTPFTKLYLSSIRQTQEVLCGAWGVGLCIGNIDGAGNFAFWFTRSTALSVKNVDTSLGTLMKTATMDGSDIIVGNSTYRLRISVASSSALTFTNDGSNKGIFIRGCVICGSTGLTFN